MRDRKTIGDIRDLYILQGTASGWSHHTLETAKRVLKFFIDSDYGVSPDLEGTNLKEELVLQYLIDR